MAIVCWERALEIEPGLTAAREHLADLLNHLPGNAIRSLQHHQALLDAEPTRRQSIRGLLQLVDGRDARVEDFGLAILRALGIAAASEQQEAPASLPLEVAGNTVLEDPLFEKVRRMAQLAAEELGQGGGTSANGSERASQGEASPEDHADGVASYLAVFERTEGELLAPALSDHTRDQLRETLCDLAAQVLEVESPSGGNAKAENAELRLGRWTRRKLRKHLEGTEIAELLAIDYAAFRAAVRSLAAAVALDRCNGDLRSALIALAWAGDSVPDLMDMSDICARVSGSPTANGLLRRVVFCFCSKVSEAIWGPTRRLEGEEG